METVFRRPIALRLRVLALVLPLALFGAGGVAAQTAHEAAHEMGHDHGAMSHMHGDETCKQPTLACASKVTPAFGPDGALWLAWQSGGHVSVARSPDLGHSFGPAVAVNPEPMNLDWGPDARPHLVIDSQGRIVVAFSIFRDQHFNGEVFISRSADGGATFSAPRPITAVQESQRFEALALDSDGRVFAAWLDKRLRREAQARGEKYIAAALTYAWSDDAGASVSETTIAHDETCECCRLGVGFAGPGRPVVVFRNVFDKTVRDHAVVTFDDRDHPGPVYRVSVDDLKTDACPHQGPSLAVGADGAYHVTWFTSGRVRRGLFYAVSRDGGRSFSEPMAIGRADHAPSRPSVLAVGKPVWLAWKEFDGDATVLLVRRSDDGGRAWGEPRAVSRTADESDHPTLIAGGGHAYLSWQTAADGYHFLQLEPSS